MRRSAQFTIFPADADRARTFYARVFGWALPALGARRCWIITAADDPRLGTDGANGRSPRHADDGPPMPTMHVEDLDATADAAHTAGGEVLVPRLPVPGLGWMAYLTDTEGNVFGILQPDPRAAWPADTGDGARGRFADQA